MLKTVVQYDGGVSPAPDTVSRILQYKAKSEYLG